MSRPKPPRHVVRPKSIDDEIRRHYFVPSPDEYRPTVGSRVNDPKPLGKVSEARVPSAHDFEPKSKSWVPGPGSYKPMSMMDCLPEGGRINRTAPADKFKLDEYPQPAPWDYGVPNDPTCPRHVNGRFSKDPRVPKFIQDEVMRSRHVPGPGAHAVQESMDSVKPFCPSGGRTLHIGKGRNYFEEAPKRIDGNPPPASYDLPSAINPNKAQGKLTYKYESATLQETKQMMVKLSDDRPGPGTYTLPESAPLGGVPALKSRAVGYAMPHPYAYNCAPDLSRNFQSLAPVRQQNSADQIYGNGLAKRGGSANAPRFTGAAVGRGRGGIGSSRPSSSGSAMPSRDKEKSPVQEKVHEGEYPQGFTSLDLNPEDCVQWRSGGFAPVMKKSASSPAAVAQQMHPSVEEVKKFYPSLVAKNREKKTFLPNTIRKPEQVIAHDNAEDYYELRRRQVEVKAVAHGIQSAASAAMEPLDLERLRKEALETIVDRASDRLLLEGVAANQHDLVVSEMLDVLNRQANAPGPADAAPDGAAAPPAGPAAAT